jgi:hypothetical protein
LLGTSSAISHRQTRDNGVDQLLQLSWRLQGWQSF